MRDCFSNRPKSKTIGLSYFCGMSSIRQQKFEALIQQEFGQYFREEARGVCMGAMVTATGVRVAPDLSFARVYLSIFGTKDIQAVYKNILTQKNQIRFERSGS